MRPQPPRRQLPSVQAYPHELSEGVGCIDDERRRLLDRPELIICLLLGASRVLAPVDVCRAIGNRAATILGEWGKRLADNTAVITARVLLVFVAALIGKCITRPS